MWFSPFIKRSAILSKRLLDCERNILLCRILKKAKSELEANELEMIGFPCTLLIGPHRFTKVQFYLSPEDSTSLIASRRSSLSILQKYLTISDGKENSESTITTKSDCDQSASSPTSRSIRKVLAKNPALCSLLSQARRSMQPPSIKPRTVFFTFDILDCPERNVFIFPSEAIAESTPAFQILQSDAISLIIHQTNGPLFMVIKGACNALYGHLQNYLYDPVKAYSFESRISDGCDAASTVCCVFPCHPPASVNLASLTCVHSTLDSPRPKRKYKSSCKAEKKKSKPKTKLEGSNVSSSLPTLDCSEDLDGQLPTTMTPVMAVSEPKVIAPIKKRKYIAAALQVQTADQNIHDKADR